MAEQEIHHKPDESTLERSLTGGLVAQFAESVTVGAGLTTGKVVVDQIVGHITSKPNDLPEPPQQVILPPGVEKE